LSADNDEHTIFLPITTGFVDSIKLAAFQCVCSVLSKLILQNVNGFGIKRISRLVNALKVSGLDLCSRPLPEILT
jgi:hypothetical protein